MALINTLRNKMGKIVVGLIGFSIAAFVMADLLGPNSTLFGNDTDIGEIAGETVSYKDFLAKQDEITFNFQQNNNGRSPSSAQQNYIRNQTWDALIADYAFTKQFDALGIDVTSDEVVDMVQGDNISPQIKQAFTNPETGEFSKDNVIQYLQALPSQPPYQQASWYNFEKSLRPTRRRTKFDNLIVNTNYVSTEEAKFEYSTSSATAEVNYFYVPFSSVKDSAVSVTDAELQSYLDEHKDEYKQDEFKEIKYVSFDVKPSAEDTAFVLAEITKLKAGFASAQNDSTFAELNSDGTDTFKNYTLETLPDAIKSDGYIAQVGEVVGPVIDGNSYALYKITSTDETEDYTARASHILFKWDDESASAKAKAKSEARSVLRQIKNGASFSEMAKEHGTDGTTSRGGDLGYFTQGKRMVKEFDDAVFGTNKTGLLADVVETQFGYHIIDVTSAKSNTTYNVAKVALEIFISDETRNKFYRDAETFALNTKSLADLEKNAKEQGLKVTTASKVTKNDQRVTGISQGRSIVFWAYNRADMGDVSEVFEIEDRYVIAGLSSEQAEGTASLASVRFEIEKKVKDQKKADIIVDKIKSFGEIDALANLGLSYDGNGAKYYSMTDLKLSSNSLQSVGLAPEAVGVIFSMEPGERTEPFAIANGVILIELVNKIEAPEISDYESYKSQVAQRRQPRLASKVDNAIKELANIEDDRYKFF